MSESINQDQKSKARLRLALRAERAFGITAIRRPSRSDSAGPPASAGASDVLAPESSASEIAPSEPTRREPPPAPTPAQAPVDLWGRPAVDQTAPQRGLVPPPAVEPFATPALSRDEKIARLRALDENEVTGCTRCRLCERRTHTVFGEGDADAKIVFIGEGPGENEDLQGRPFVGRAGEKLNEMIAAMGLRREQVYIANIVKCLRYNTLVQLENGAWERIGRLVRQRYAGRVVSVGADGALVCKRVTGWHETPLAGRRVYKVSYASSALRGGNRAVAWMTHDHPVLTRRGWVVAQELQATDEIAVGQGLSRVAHDVVVGSLLGDGTISPRNSYLGIGHCRDQKQYAHLKADALRELKPVIYDSSVVVKRTGREHLTTRLRTLASRPLRILQGRFYDCRQKRVPRDLRLTPRVLAIWFMDDGHLRTRPGKAPLAEIAAHSFSAHDIDLLITRLTADMNIVAYRRDSSPGRIHFGVDATRRLSEAIAPYCPPGMRFKLHPTAAEAAAFDPGLFAPGPAETMYDKVVVEQVSFTGTDRTFFCIDVADTHNFVTSGGVVHNCRPPGNREPSPDEVATCTPYLERQLEIIRPRVIVTLGRPAAQHMLQTKISISRIRGQWQNWRGIRLMPTFHPAYILRNYTRETREAVWSDLKQVLVELGLPTPTRRGGKSE